MLSIRFTESRIKAPTAAIPASLTVGARPPGHGADGGSVCARLTAGRRPGIVALPAKGGVRGRPGVAGTAAGRRGASRQVRASSCSRHGETEGPPVRDADAWNRLRTLLDDLGTLTLNQLRLPGHGESLLTVVTTPTRVQKRAFELLGVKPDQNVPIRMTGWLAALGPETR